MVPKQGQHERTYVLVTFLRDDNGDEVEGTTHILAGTTSLKIGEKAFQVFSEARNGVVTMINEEKGERFFPQDAPNLRMIMGGKDEHENDEHEKAPESIDVLLSKVDI